MNTPWELQCDSAMTASVHRGETLYFLKMKETDGWHPLDSMDAQTGPFKVNIPETRERVHPPVLLREVENIAFFDLLACFLSIVSHCVHVQTD